MLKTGLIDKNKDKNDQYIIGVWDRIFNIKSNFIQFSKIERVLSLDQASEVRANKFKELQLDWRLGKFYDWHYE